MIIYLEGPDMAKIKYGADVRYITCKRDDLKTVPLIDGQIITFFDADGIFYDIEGTRHTVGNFLTVNELPEFGVENTLYVIYTKDAEDTVLPMNICIWSEKEQLYYKLIPEPVIADDAPDDGWYLRTKGKWSIDHTIFYIDDEWSAETCFTKLQDFLNQFSQSSNVIKIVGALPLVKGKVLDAPTHLDFSSCSTSAYDIESVTSYPDNWFNLKIINSHGISRLYGTNIWIILDSEPIASNGGKISIYDCMLWDSRVDVSGSMNTVQIKDNTFLSYDKDVVPVINSEKKSAENKNVLYIYNNQFTSMSVTQFATFIDERRENILNKNSFIKSIPLSRKSASSLDISTNIAPGGSIVSASEIIDCTNSNSTTVLDLDNEESKNLDLNLILELARKKSNYNLFRIGKTFIASNIFLGIADMKQGHVVFEVMPNTVNHIDNILSLEVPDDATLRPIRLGEMLDVSGKDTEYVKDILRDLASYLTEASITKISNMINFGNMFDVYKLSSYEAPHATYPDEYDKGYPGNAKLQLYAADSSEENVFAIYQDIDSGRFGAKFITQEELQNSDARYVLEVETEV